ncbi:MAG: hypothetical protein ACQSGP_21345 [Frankia sp.]
MTLARPSRAGSTAFVALGRVQHQNDRPRIQVNNALALEITPEELDEAIIRGRRRRGNRGGTLPGMSSSRATMSPAREGHPRRPDGRRSVPLDPRET